MEKRNMIAMLDTSHDLELCSKELGCEVEQLLTPLTRYRPQQPKRMFAIDNGAFSRFDARSYRSLLSREYPRRDLCRFVTAPDVVGSAIRTLEVFQCWKGEISEWPIALVAQDGQEMLPIPWGEIQAVFVGGSTDWKMSKHAAAVIKAAKAIGKWVHVGRVNSPGRFDYFDDLGVDSIDGTGLARYTHMREKINKEFREPVMI